MIDPLDVMQEIRYNLEPIASGEVEILSLPSIIPINQVIVKKAAKEDGVYAQLSCPKGQDS